MPIYAYKCSACGHELEVLQKISDDPLTVCPACSQSSFSKQVTAAGFQLKGSGWYVTDFRNGSGKKAESKTDGKTETTTEAKTDGAAETKTDAKPAEAPKTESKPAEPAKTESKPAAAKSPPQA